MPAHCPALFAGGERHVREAFGRVSALLAPVNALLLRLTGGHLKRE